MEDNFLCLYLSWEYIFFKFLIIIISNLSRLLSPLGYIVYMTMSIYRKILFKNIFQKNKVKSVLLCTFLLYRKQLAEMAVDNILNKN